ncbi:unnamed protein product [Pedinophyceae sp. YPF-701]|nr:unnamed protein product [Pedinophyceae sp. YPF-701]
MSRQALQLWRSVRAVVHRLQGRELVGTDPLGNEYFRQSTHEDDGSVREKRLFVPHHGSQAAHDLEWNEIPPAWNSWLNYTRHDPPTHEEIAKAEEYRKSVAMRAHDLAREEEKRRWRRASSAAAAEGGADAGPDMSAFVQQLRGAGQFSEQGPPRTGPASGNKPPPPPGEFKPESWTPGSK